MADIDLILDQVSAGATLSVPDSWSQGRTVFGGLTAAILNRAMTSELSPDKRMRVQTTQFIGPLLVDAPFSVQVEHLRDGKNVTQLQANIVQDGDIVAQGLAAFGGDRESKVRVQAEARTDLSVPKKPNWIPQIPKVTPKFFRHIEIHIEQGGMPFTGKKTSHYRGAMRFKSAPEVLDDAHLLALIDAWPPAVLQLLRWPAPASTLSWNVEYLHPHPTLKGTDWLYYDCTTRQAADGYAHTEATVQAPDGTLLALARQTITVFD